MAKGNGREDEGTPWLAWALFGLAAVFFLVTIVAAIRALPPTGTATDVSVAWQRAALRGDFWSGHAALLAFSGTLLLAGGFLMQQRELQLQRVELREGRKVAKEQAQALDEQSTALEEQNVLTKQQTKLTRERDDLQYVMSLAGKCRSASDDLSNQPNAAATTALIIKQRRDRIAQLALTFVFERYADMLHSATLLRTFLVVSGWGGEQDQYEWFKNYVDGMISLVPPDTKDRASRIQEIETWQTDCAYEVFRALYHTQA